jgi:hypothetical protein
MGAESIMDISRISSSVGIDYDYCLQGDVRSNEKYNYHYRYNINPALVAGWNIYIYQE